MAAALDPNSLQSFIFLQPPRAPQELCIQVYPLPTSPWGETATGKGGPSLSSKRHIPPAHTPATRLGVLH